LRRLNGHPPPRARRRGPPEIIAHRANGGGGPENTLRGLRKALALGPDLVEIDVHRTRDGELVVLHDARLDRTTDGHGLASHHTWEQLSGLTVGGAGSDDRLSRLADVLEMVRAHPWAGLMIDIKHLSRFPVVGYPGIATKVAAEVRRLGMEKRVRVSAFDLDALREMRFLLPGAPLVLHWDEHDASRHPYQQPEKLAAEAARAGVTGLSVNRAILTPAIIAAAHHTGLRVDTWVVDDPIEAICFEDLGVDGMITDRPDALVPWARAGLAQLSRGAAK
jgi:glycerophosphoryl diester phosphodiesterase